MAAPGMAAPEISRTIPDTEAPTICARAGLAARVAIRNRVTASRERIDLSERMDMRAGSSTKPVLSVSPIPGVQSYADALLNLRAGGGIFSSDSPDWSAGEL